MHDHSLTKHARTRMQQRGLRVADAELLVGEAFSVAPDVYIMTDSAATSAIERRKREITQIEKLRGCKVVVEAGEIITIYRPSPRNLRSAIRRGRDASFSVGD